MATTLTKTLLAALLLGTASLATPALANGQDFSYSEEEQHGFEDYPTEEGVDCAPYVAAMVEGSYNEADLEVLGCGQATVEVLGNGNVLHGYVDGDGLVWVRQANGSFVAFEVRDEAQAGVVAMGGSTTLGLSGEARAAVENYGGDIAIEGTAGDVRAVADSGSVDIQSNNPGGSISVVVGRNN